MRNSFFILVLVCFSACQSIKIKDSLYKVSSTTPELGSIGQSKSFFYLQNTFNVRTLPKLENNIRVAIEVIPFNKRVHHFYKAKEKYDQNQLKVNYIDSLETKPEIVAIKILDATGFVKELNAAYNTTIFKLLVDAQKLKIVSSVAVVFSTEEITKIRASDTYYLTNHQDDKYVLSLYKLGKKTESLDIKPDNIVAYSLSKFCWALSETGKWYVADMVEGGTDCKGNTTSKIKNKKKTKSLFDM